MEDLIYFVNFPKSTPSDFLPEMMSSPNLNFGTILDGSSRAKSAQGQILSVNEICKRKPL